MRLAGKGLLKTFLKKWVMGRFFAGSASVFCVRKMATIVSQFNGAIF